MAFNGTLMLLRLRLIEIDEYQLQILYTSVSWMRHFFSQIWLGQSSREPDRVNHNGLE